MTSSSELDSYSSSSLARAIAIYLSSSSCFILASSRSISVLCNYSTSSALSTGASRSTSSSSSCLSSSASSFTVLVLFRFFLISGNVLYSVGLESSVCSCVGLVNETDCSRSVNFSIGPSSKSVTLPPLLSSATVFWA